MIIVTDEDIKIGDIINEGELYAMEDGIPYFISNPVFQVLKEVTKEDWIKESKDHGETNFTTSEDDRFYLVSID